jgi:histidinol-phosphate aminotransferase
VTARLATRPRLFFVCNPNNPTGTLLNPSVIVRLARGAPDTLVVVDELYAPFTGQSVVPAALALDNVVALHSLSTTAGLAAGRRSSGPRSTS